MSSGSIAQEPAEKSFPWDTLALLFWAIVIFSFAVMRQDFIGDGIRHLPGLLEAKQVPLGDFRWILFPTLLYFLIKPAMTIGWVHDWQSAIHLLLHACFFSSLIYMICLKKWLTLLTPSAIHRALVLLLAGFSVPLIRLGSDTSEPMIAAALAIMTLTYAKCRIDRTKHPDKLILLCVSLLFIASLIYQGLALSIFLLPCAIPATYWSRKKIWVKLFFLGLCLGGIAVGAVMVSKGYSLGRALGIILANNENALYVSHLKGGYLLSPVVAFVAGVPQGLFYFRDFSGLRHLYSKLFDPTLRLEGTYEMGLIMVGLVIVLYCIFLMIRRRQWPILIGFAGMLILPVLLRSEQYSYIKFYILFPFLLALMAIHVRPKALILFALLLILVNGTAAFQDVSEGRRLHASVSPMYAKLDSNACWVSDAYEPPMNYKWSGRSCGLIKILGSGRGENTEELMAKQHQALKDCYRECFCESTGVFTIGMNEKHRERILTDAEHFKFDDAKLLESVVLDENTGITVLEYENVSVKKYTKKQQVGTCEAFANEGS